MISWRCLVSFACVDKLEGVRYLRYAANSRVKLLRLDLQEWLDEKARVDVVNGSGELALGQGFPDVCHGTVEGGWVTDVCGDADSLPAGLPDLVDGAVEGVCLSGKQHDGICLGEPLGDGMASAANKSNRPNMRVVPAYLMGFSSCICLSGDICQIPV